jgi:hypothetical protein
MTCFSYVSYNCLVSYWIYSDHHFEVLRQRENLKNGNQFFGLGFCYFHVSD